MKKHVRDLEAGAVYKHTEYNTIIRIVEHIRDKNDREGVRYDILGNPPPYMRSTLDAKMYVDCPFCQKLIKYPAYNTPLWKALNG
jgi:hypothetical protein